MAVDPPGPSPEITRLLREWQDGDRTALDRLIPLVYNELHDIAARHMSREARDGTLQTTGLVNEAYLKLVDQRTAWQNRGHFFSIAAKVMRRILLDDARRRLRKKRGGAAVKVTIDDASITAPVTPVAAADLLAIDRALRNLEQLDPNQAKIVELRFFGGLTVDETSAALGVSPATVKREWAVAKGWLYRELHMRT